MSFKNKVVIITGASSGIGKALAIAFFENGAKVVLAARSKDKLEKLSKQLPGSLVVETDMSREKDIKNMVAESKKHFGRVDILVNNAGQGYDAKVEEINAKTFNKIFNLDLSAPVISMGQVIPIMKKQKEGIIVNISSGTALMILPSMSAYAALKQALAKISLTAREELKNDNIHVSVVYPFITATDFEKNTIKEDQKKGKTYENGEDDWQPPKIDTAEYIAKKILAGIEKDEAEIFAHDWMKKI